jgi:hypothetical protein
MRKVLGLLGIILLSGCASGGPVPTGNGSYYLTKKSAGCGFSGGEGSKADLLREANAFCAKRGQRVKTREAISHDGVPFARCASAEVEFICETTN